MLKISLPKNLNSQRQVILYKWLKNVGDKIEQSDVICSVQVESEFFEVESGIPGHLLEILVGPGFVFDGTVPIAILGDKGQDASGIAEKLRTKTGVSTPETQQKTEPKQSLPSSDQKTSKSGDNSMTQNNASAAANGPVIPILMPQAGQSMEEGTILSWKVKEGDRIEVGQIIMEIETDKATMEVEAVDAGRIAKIIAKEGDIVEVKVPVAYLAEEGVDVDAVIGSGGTTPTAATATPASATTEAKPAVTPMTGDVTPVLMPQAGQSMEEGTILSWKIKEGDRIEVGQII
ncbi:MAG TPA: biotin/lipoyl-binding protein, partial [Alphaproteobacteria bacterium]|nr:biotin/lipoyl-binding protein [Alphaproteobacteria bacterium]